MFNKVISTIEQNKMLMNGTTVIVAVSGGADSMALLSILVRMREKYNLNLLAAHVNHGLRGAESERDENFVRYYCKKNSIEIRILKTSIAELASSSGEGLEQCGRRVRYEFFSSLNDNAVVATAHTLSDRIETILFNLTRGSALKGLCGMPAMRDRIIRPLFECTRCEVEEYCLTNSLPYINDSTNTNDDYTRNHIRMNIIPQLGRINPRFEQAIRRCSESLALDEDLLNKLSVELLDHITVETGSYQTTGLMNAHPSLRKRALAKILQIHTGILPEYKHIDALDSLLRKGGRFQIQNHVIATIESGLLILNRPEVEYEKWRFDLNDGTFEMNDKSITTKIVNKIDLDNKQNIHKNILDNCLDYDKIIGNSVIRSRCAGDKIRLSKRHCTKSIKKLFNEASLPVWCRNKVAVIADDAGVLWVESFGVAERCEITNGTKRILMITVRRDLYA